MKIKIITHNGSRGQREVEADDRIFQIVPNSPLIDRAIHNERANKRLGTASTKDRSMIKGSTKKPWKQKGTGRSRAGSVKSPIWRGGGITFGPKPRDYSYQIPRKMKRLSIFSVLSKKLIENRLRIIEDINLKEAKTKYASSLLYNMSLFKDKESDLKNSKLQKKLNSYRLTIITDDENQSLKRSIKNLPWVKYLSYRRLNVYDLFYSHEIMVEEQVLDKLTNLFFKDTDSTKLT